MRDLFFTLFRNNYLLNQTLAWKGRRAIAGQTIAGNEQLLAASNCWPQAIAGHEQLLPRNCWRRAIAGREQLLAEQLLAATEFRILKFEFWPKFSNEASSSWAVVGADDVTASPE